MEFSAVSMNTWLYPDSAIDSAKYEIKLSAVRGGSTGFQILCTGLGAGRMKVLPAAPAGANCTLEAYRELSVRVELNTGANGLNAKSWDEAKGYATRKAPFRVYDALEPVPEDGLDIPAGTQAIYISVKAESDCAPGTYEGTVRVDVDGECVQVKYELTVAAAKLPDESLNLTLFFSLSSMATEHGVEKWSEEHWKLIEAYGRLMRRMHQNVFWVTWDTVKVTPRADGGFDFDFANCERLIDLYLKLGFTTIEGAPVFGRVHYEDSEFSVEDTPMGAIPALSNQAYDYVAGLLTGWRNLLKRRGWYERTIQHVGDEPNTRVADEYRVLSGIVRKFMPGIRLIDAVEMYELRGSLDIWVPRNIYYAENRAPFEHLRSLGDELWFYTCCQPGGHYCNRLLDMPLLRTRMLFWGNYKYNLTGYLHWGLNHWTPGTNPYEDTCTKSGPDSYWPAGDTHIVYPLGGNVIGSMRAEMTRCGTEDYEMLRQLSQTQPEHAKAICDRIFRAFDDCDNSAADFDAAHDELVMSAI